MKFHALATACILLLGVMDVRAQPAPGRITIMVSGIEKQVYLPVKLADQLGYFKEQGLNVDLQSNNSGVNAATALMAGEIQGVVGYYDHTLDLQAKNKVVTAIVQFTQTPGYAIVVASRANEITAPKDLEGHAVGVNALGSSSQFLTQYVVGKAGVGLEKLDIVPVGSGSTFIAALEQRRIDAGMTTEPTISRMLKNGNARMLVDLRTPDNTRRELGGAYPGSCLYMTAIWLSAHKDEAQKLANALVKSMKYIDAHSAQDIAEKMPQDYYAGDKAAYVQVLAENKSMFTRDGLMPADGPQTVRAVLQRFNQDVQGKHIDLSKTFTPEFAKNAQ